MDENQVLPSIYVEKIKKNEDLKIKLNIVENFKNRFKDGLSIFTLFILTYIVILWIINDRKYIYEIATKMSNVMNIYAFYFLLFISFIILFFIVFNSFLFELKDHYYGNIKNKKIFLILFIFLLVQIFWFYSLFDFKNNKSSSFILFIFLIIIM